MQRGADVGRDDRRFGAVGGFSQAIAEPEMIKSRRNVEII